MANKMAEKKKNASRVQQLSEPAPVAKEGTSSTKEVSAKAARETRKEQPKQENRSAARRDTKGSTTLQARFRNNRIGRFILEAYYELRHKVTWPTTNEARNMTIMVVLLSAVVAVILALADLGLYHLFLLISGGS